MAFLQRGWNGVFYKEDGMASFAKRMKNGVFAKRYGMAFLQRGWNGVFAKRYGQTLLVAKRYGSDTPMMYILFSSLLPQVSG